MRPRSDHFRTEAKCRPRIHREPAERARKHDERVADGAADGSDERAAHAEEDARHGNDHDVERDVRRMEIAAQPCQPGDKQHVAENLRPGLQLQPGTGEAQDRHVDH